MKGRQGDDAGSIPPLALQAQRFLSRRGLMAGRTGMARGSQRAHGMAASPQGTASTAQWQPLGPAAVISQNYGLVTGRVSTLALDPADLTGNRLYVGTTGGGVWLAQNAATANVGNVVFTPLTDTVGALNGAFDASISIGALTVQPGGTGVILAGTGDPNDALDSYYGAGVLRSADGGKTWSVIQETELQGAGAYFGFLGEAFAGFAWSTVNPQMVVAAVGEAYEGLLVRAGEAGLSYGGLYYSSDAGVTWHLARISDGNGSDVQGPLDAFAGPDGNAATSVVWNPVRGLFVAAVRFHGYYQSADGVTWTRLVSQPASGLTTVMCPTNPTMTGSPACPIWRGALAVNPLTGDTFAWTVDLNNQDQGIWQDVCAASEGMCTQSTIAFGKQWGTAALETDTFQGAATIANGDYNLVLAAVPQGQETELFAGGNDLWRCSLAMGCAWRNTTNATTCMSAGVGPYQHALEWSAANPLEVFVGNDSGLWRSMDSVGESGTVCAADDASHFQNLNGGLGSLAQVESMSGVGMTPYTMMAGLGVNGTAAANTASGPTADWLEILDGEGGPVSVDPVNANNWYVNNGAGVSIHFCAKGGACTAADFGTAPAVNNADVGGDGLAMTAPAPFLVDPADPAQVLIGTCRVWRGPANGVGWTAANAISTMLDGNHGSASCHGNALIRSMAAMALPGGGEVAYVGTYGSLNGGGTLPGHVLTATMSANGAWGKWQDLKLNPVTNDSSVVDAFDLDISSVAVDPHDPTGNTVYVTVAGLAYSLQKVFVAYRSTDGGAHWTEIVSNLPPAPANALVVDPVDASTVYLATDLGVYVTQKVADCENPGVSCWSPYGAGLPMAPVVALSASPGAVNPGVLVAGTYGRGLWEIPLLAAGAQSTTASVSPASLAFGSQAVGTTSAAQSVTLVNSGQSPLQLTQLAVTGDFSETDDCANASIPPGDSCAIQVTFSPIQAGSRTGQLTIEGNFPAGPMTLALNGMGASQGVVSLLPARIDFNSVEVGTTSDSLQVTVENSGASAVPITSLSVTAPFVLSSNACGTASLAANSDCQLLIQFSPVTAGPASGTLTLIDGAGTHLAQLTGTGTAPPTDTLTPGLLVFGGTIVGQNSAAQVLTLTNNGGNPLTSIAVSTSGPFQASTNCTTQLAAQASCAINVTFLPSAIGVQTGTLTVADILKAQTVTLSGTGLLPPAISVNPATLSFGSTQAGFSSNPLSLTVTNSGGAAMANVGFQVSGQSAGSFATGATTCGATLTVGSSCTVQVVFAPMAIGDAAATLTVTSSTPGVKAVAVPLSGTGQSTSGLTVTPAQLTFAAAAIAQASPAQTVTFKNLGGTNITGLNFSVFGPFGLAQNGCGAMLQAGASCATGVVFNPTKKGALTGTLTANFDGAAFPVIVALSGIGGLSGAVEVLPALLSFPITGVGTTSIPNTITVTNTSTSMPLNDLSLATTVGFRLAANTCGTSLAPGAGCTTGVVFAPAAAGAQTGALTIASSTLAADASVPLSGTAFDFAAQVSGAGSQTVASGQAANYTFTLLPAAGMAATFTFQCSSLPSYAACVFNPSSNSVAAGATGSETAQITTSQSTAMVAPPRWGDAGKAMILVCGLMLLPLATRNRRKLYTVILFLGIGAAGLSSCSGAGGGGGGAPPVTPTTHSTPAGTYLIQVSVSSYGVSHTVPVTLVVD